MMISCKLLALTRVNLL